MRLWWEGIADLGVIADPGVDGWKESIHLRGTGRYLTCEVNTYPCLDTIV